MRELIRNFLTDGRAAPLGNSEAQTAERRALTHRLFQITGGRVFGGVFAGMRLPEVGLFLTTPSLVVGSYEEELHEAIIRVVIQGPPSVVNIGSAEGYYPVGMARLTDEAKIFAFDLDESCWSQCRECARANQVEDRIEQQGECSPFLLQQAISPGSVVICDCEGAELILLNPSEVPGLRECTIICELHDFFQKDVTTTLLRRFRDTHRISILHQRERRPDDYLILQGFSRYEGRLAVHENRHIEGVPFIARYMVLFPKGE